MVSDTTTMKKYLFSLVLYSTGILLSAQIPMPSGRLLIEKAEDFVYDNIDSALHYAHEARQIATQTQNNTLLFDAYRAIGYINEENSRYDDARKAYESALNLAELSLTEKDKCAIYTDWAILHKKMGRYDMTFDYHWRTITTAQKIQNWELIEMGYNGLGTMYTTTNQYDKAIQYYLKSIEAAERWDNQEGIILTQENITSIHLSLKNYDSALKTISETYKKSLLVNNNIRTASVLKLYGDTELALGKEQEALAKYREAIDIFIKNDDKSALAEAYMSLGNFYFQQKKLEEANIYYQKCEELSGFLSPVCYADFYAQSGSFYIAQKKIPQALKALNISLAKAELLGLKDIAKKCHLYFADIKTQQHQFETAAQHLRIAQQLSDSLYAQNKSKIYTEAQLKFDLEKRDIQIESQQKALTDSLRIHSILGFLLLMVILLLFFVWRQMKAKLNAMQHVELLMKELHHRVKNNLQTVTSIMRLQARHISDPSVSAVLAESRSRLEAIAMIHQQLYRSENVQVVNFKLFLEDLIEKLRFAYGMQDKPFKSSIEIEKELINVDLALPLGLIINELLTNSFKYAYSKVEEPNLTIQLNMDKLYYADNGKGLPENFTPDKTQSFGVQLISSLANQIRGKFKFGNNNGMYFNLVLR